MEDRKYLCDEDCNNCKLITGKNSRMITFILNKLHDRFGNDVYRIVQDCCPNLTVCYDCRFDDFCHLEDCKIIEKIKSGK